MEKSPIKSIEVVALIAFSLVAQSLASVFVKLTGRETFLSLKFCLYFGGAILLLGLFAIMWQLLLERIPLSLAYMRKGIVYILILIWSVIFFGETITTTNLVGSAIIIIGVAVGADGD